MKTIVISDIHGCYTELKTLLSSLEENEMYNKDTDKLIFLGDYVDRGENSRQVVQFIRNLQENNKNVIALMGNHEDMMLNDYYEICDPEYFNGNKRISKFSSYNGLSSTIKSYMGYYDQLKDDLQWMKNLPLYHEDDNFIYVHAGVDINKPMEQQDRHTLLWVRDTFILNRDKYYKRVIFGHTPTIMINGMYKPVYTYANNIAIDTGCVFGGALSALIIEDGEILEFCQVYNEENENV